MLYLNINASKNGSFSTVTRNTILDNTITIAVNKVRSLSKHANDIVRDKTVMNNDIIGFTETQINPQLAK